MSEFVSHTIKKTDFISGTYELRIEGFSQYPKTRASKIVSPKFKLVNREWTISIVFCGTNESDNVMVPTLHNEQADSDVSTSFRFILVNQKQKSASKRTIIANKLFSKKGIEYDTEKSDKWGVTKTFYSSFLTNANSPFIVNDTVIFRVEISVVGEKAPEAVSTQANLAWNELFMSGLGSDVTVVTEKNDKQAVNFPAHKCILMVRSPVFKAMFTHNMSESNTNEIVISDFSPDVVREMLHFMYTDKLQSETLDNTVYEGLLGASIKYDVPGLIKLCERHFSAKMAHDNVLEMHKMADRCGSMELTVQAVSYIKQHIATLVNNVEFQPMLDNFLSFNVHGSLGEGSQNVDSAPTKSAIKNKKRKDNRNKRKNKSDSVNSNT